MTIATLEFHGKNGGELDVVFIGYGALNVARDREIGRYTPSFLGNEGDASAASRGEAGTSFRRS